MFCKFKGEVNKNLKKIFYQIAGISHRVMPFSVIKYLQYKYIYLPRIEELEIRKDKIPLFDTVFFEVRTKCNGRCSFCAASVPSEKRDDTLMPLSMYEKVISELKNINFDGRIAYHVNNDPLIFPDLLLFVTIARNNLPDSWIQILTNGKALTAKKGEELLKAGINELSVNRYSKNYYDPLSKEIIEFKENVLPQFYDRKHIENGHRNKHEAEKIFKFNIFTRLEDEVLSSRGGTSPNKIKVNSNLYGFCEYPFSQVNITTDGRVSKCCADLYFSDIMGNVNENTISDIWYGEKFQHVRHNLLEGNRQTLLNCRECDFYGSKKTTSNLFTRIIYNLTRQL